MRRGDRAVGAAFFALGLSLLVSAARFPPGVGGLPGPGFFPSLIGAGMVVLSLALLGSGFARRARPAPAQHVENPHRSLAGLGAAVALTALYLAFWDEVPFAFRTALFITVFLRSQAQPWRASLQVAAVVTAAVVAAFEYGLRVHLP